MKLSQFHEQVEDAFDFLYKVNQYGPPDMNCESDVFSAIQCNWQHLSAEDCGKGRGQL
jgi:hypothetical protein